MATTAAAAVAASAMTLRSQDQRAILEVEIARLGPGRRLHSQLRGARGDHATAADARTAPGAGLFEQGAREVFGRAPAGSRAAGGGGEGAIIRPAAEWAGGRGVGGWIRQGDRLFVVDQSDTFAESCTSGARRSFFSLAFSSCPLGYLTNDRRP